MGWSGGVSASLSAKLKTKSEKLTDLALKYWGDFVNGNSRLVSQ